jgi:hypothetical protein
MRLCEAWHNNLPACLNNQIEQIQKRALQIIYPSFTYSQGMLTANLSSLCDRRSNLCERLFDRILDPGHELNSLVPALRINKHNLRHNRCFKVPDCRTDRYHNSFIPSVASLYDMKHIQHLTFNILKSYVTTL